MSDERMTDDEYLAVQMQLAGLEVVVASMPLQAFIDRARHAQTVARFIDPTLYMRNGEALDKIVRWAEAVRRLQHEADPVKALEVQA